MLKLGSGRSGELQGTTLGSTLGLNTQLTCSRQSLKVRRDTASHCKELRGQFRERKGPRDRKTQDEPPRRGRRKIAQGLAGRRGSGLCPTGSTSRERVWGQMCTAPSAVRGKRRSRNPAEKRWYLGLGVVTVALREVNALKKYLGNRMEKS